MNKMIMTALVLVASASLFTASAAGKGKKKGQGQEASRVCSSVGFSFRLVELCCRNESKQSGFDTLSSAGLSG